MDAPEVVPGENGRVIEECKNMRLSIFDIGYRSEGKVLIDECFYNRVPLAEGHVHLDRALAVPDVMEFLFCDIVYIGEDSWEIVVSHMLEGELPELFVFVWVVLGVISRVLVAPAVSQPDIVALVREQEPGSLVLIVDDPGIGAVEESVLQEDRLEPFFDDRTLPLDSKEGEDVSIFGDYFVSLHWVVVKFAIVGKVKFGLGVGAVSCNDQ